MQGPLKILMLEDNEQDAQLIRRELSKELDYGYKWARNREEFMEYLDTYHPDIIVSDNTLPRFTGLEALGIAREFRKNIPFILVTGTVSEEYAVQILKSGADDYVLKDRMIRLPSAIRLAIEQKRMQQELADYKYGLDSAGMVTITDGDGIITYANAIFCATSGYELEELTGKDHTILQSGVHSKIFFDGMWSTISKGNIWRDTICNRGKDGQLFWTDTSIIPFMDASGKPYQYLSIWFDVSEKKRLEYELIERQRKEQARVTATALAAQEKERNAIGLELHDNVNQLLAGALIFLKMAVNKPGADNSIHIETAIEGVQAAVFENRKIAHQLVSPDQQKNLVEQVQLLAQHMLEATGITVRMDTGGFDEQLTGEEMRLAIYRIMQEQFTNITKYSQASIVDISIQTGEGKLKAAIADNGIGMESLDGKKGIGLRNINARLSILNGHSHIHSAPGQGFRMDIEIPL